jgi:hypothetical protein
MSCECPENPVLVDIDNVECVENLSALKKFLFQLPGYTFGTDSDPIDEKATWDALLAASDATKVSVTPLLVGGDQIPMGEAITSDVDGNQLVDGENNILVTKHLRNVPGTIVAQLKRLACQINARGGVVVFVNDFDKLIAQKVGEGQHKGIPIIPGSMYVGSAGAEGRATPNHATIQFNIPSDWRDTIDIVTPEAGFSPLTDIKTVAGE